MSGLVAGEPSRQWEWHEAHRDMAKNMYRTSYSDMSHGREVHVRSDYPSGYGGHIPSLRHDMLFRNTAFDRNVALRRSDPCRDAHPSFDDQLAGVPTSTRFPRGARRNPTKGVVPHDGTTTAPKPPWGLLTNRAREALGPRAAPPTLRGGLQASASSPALPARANAAALGAGALLAGAGPAAPGAPGAGPAPASPWPASPGERLRRSVSVANAEARRGRMPTESEVLAEQMRQAA